MNRLRLVIGGLLAVGLLMQPLPARGASGQVTLPLNHRLNGILVDVLRPRLIFGEERVSHGFVATRDGLILAPLAGLEEVALGGDVQLEWMDKRRADGWLIWKDEEAGYVVIRLLEPMPLFPSMGWSRSAGPRVGDRVFTPGPTSGGQPTLQEASVVGLHDIILPSGRHVRRAILLNPSLGSGPLSGPLLDEAGYLVGMVSTLRAPASFGPQTVVAVPAGALEPDLRAARNMRPPRVASPPAAYARPSFGVGIGIGSGGVSPRFGVGFGGYGRPGPYGTLRDRWDQTYDPTLRREQETSDQAKTEALERALEEQTGGEPGGAAPFLTNSQPLAQGEAPQAAGGPWKAGASSVATSPDSGQVREVSPEAYRPEAPSIGSTWNPAGPPQAQPPAPPQNWPVVVEPKVPPSLKTEQEQTDRAQTENLERELARRGVEGSPAGSPEELTVLAGPPSGQPREAEASSELAEVQARNRQLERELEALKQSLSGR